VRHKVERKARRFIVVAFGPRLAVVAMRPRPILMLCARSTARQDSAHGLASCSLRLLAEDAVRTENLPAVTQASENVHVAFGAHLRHRCAAQRAIHLDARISHQVQPGAICVISRTVREIMTRRSGGNGRGIRTGDPSRHARR